MNSPNSSRPASSCISFNKSSAFVKFATELGKTITGTAKADFLCNKTKALNLPKKEGQSVIRLSFGPETTREDIDLPIEEHLIVELYSK